MNLSNRLTFSLIFSVVLVAAFALAVAPAMAQVTVTAYQATVAGDSSATPVVPRTITITLTYSEAPNPRPDFSHFTANDDEITEPDDTEPGDNPVELRDVLTAAYNNGTQDITVAIGGEGTTVTLTFTQAGGNSFALPTGLQLKGYSTALTGAGADLANATPLVLEANYIAGKAYIVYIRGTDATTITAPAPVLPASLGDTTSPTADSQLVRTVVDMPDLEEFFNVGGGTIDLVVEGVGDREVIINEIMWGVDNSQVGQASYLNQQWIEVYNTKTTPAAAPSFTFTDDTFPAPAKGMNVVDRISNISGFQNVWSPAIKGSSGTATRDESSPPAIIGANPAFVSVYRSNGGDGTKAGHWTASNRVYFPGFMGTPGSANTRGGLPTTRTDPTAYTPPKDKLIINEVFNATGNTNDWIELRAVAGAVNIENWQLTYTSATGRAETPIIKFPKRTVGAGEVLLIVNTDPANTNLAEGFDITVAAANQRRGAGPQKYLILSDFNIPDGIGDGYLILRTADDGKGHLEGRRRLHDVAGPNREAYNTLALADEVKEPGAGFWKTDVWPINGQDFDDAKLNDFLLQTDRTFESRTDNDKTWSRNGTNDGWKKNGGSLVGYVGGLGYKRNVQGPGTPGFHNDVVKHKSSDLDGGSLIISELMLTTDNGRYPQWIELQNTSKTRGINLADDGVDPKVPWRMTIENHNSGKWAAANTDKTVVTINLTDLFSYIPPDQTVLIVSDFANNSNRAHFPTHRVASIWDNKKDDFLMDSRRDIFLNAEGGFYIKITDSNGATVDEIGNLDGQAANVRTGLPYDNAYGWNWVGAMTEDDGSTPFMTADGKRTSLLRLKNADGSARAGIPVRPVDAVPDDPATADVDESKPAVAANMTRGAVLPMGTEWRGNNTKPGTGKDMIVWSGFAGYAWVHAVDTKLARAQTTWYGDDSDIGTPLHTTGTPLPVSLSFFRPTLEDGKVVIRWTTESELDNAGFNILRSEDRNGEFTKVNEQLIQGKGTTAERSTYKWVDSSAKPGAIYYYQIEDVSFAGERNTLTTTKLKGLISAKNKLTTTWSELKSQN